MQFNSFLLYLLDRDRLRCAIDDRLRCAIDDRLRCTIDDDRLRERLSGA